MRRQRGNRIFATGVPVYWGPGPWDDDWPDQPGDRYDDLYYRSGDLRAATEIEYGGPIVTAPPQDQSSPNRAFDGYATVMNALERERRCKDAEQAHAVGVAKLRALLDGDHSIRDGVAKLRELIGG